MEQSHFYVSHEGQSFGPLSVDEIVGRIKTKALNFSDYLYDEAQQDWVMIMAHPILQEPLKNFRPSLPPRESIGDSGGTLSFAIPADAAIRDPEWYVLKGDLRFGPFTQAEVVRLIQDKSIALTDYIWQPKMKAWEKIDSIEEFSAESVRKLKDSGLPGLNEVFFRRRHARVAYGASIIVHNDKQVFKGKSMEIAEGGAGLLLDTDSLEQGQKVFLHFKPAAELPAFNARCEVISKRMINSADKSAPVHYGVKFSEIQQSTVSKIQELAMKRAG